MHFNNGMYRFHILGIYVFFKNVTPTLVVSKNKFLL